MSAISADNMKKAYAKANENNYVSKGDVVLALLEKGQHSTRYKLGESWELNLFEIQEAIDAMPNAVIDTAEMNQFAYDWIIELKAQERSVRQAFLNRNRDWRSKVEYAIKKEVWKESYRKVSQLCYTIGGDIQQKFEDEFPYENKNYKTGYLLEED